MSSRNIENGASLGGFNKREVAISALGFRSPICCDRHLINMLRLYRAAGQFRNVSLSPRSGYSTLGCVRSAALEYHGGLNLQRRYGNKEPSPTEAGSKASQKSTEPSKPSPRNPATDPEDANYAAEPPLSGSNDGTSVTGTPVFHEPSEKDDKVKFVAGMFETEGTGVVKETGEKEVYRRPWGKTDDQMVGLGDRCGTTTLIAWLTAAGTLGWQGSSAWSRDGT